MLKGLSKLGQRSSYRFNRIANYLGRWKLPVVVGVMLLAAWSPGAGAQTTWYVDDDAAGDPEPGNPAVSDPLEDGSAEHPFDAIQEGINAAAAGDEVVLADGIYTGFGNKELDYGGKDITVRSASGHADACVIDCQEEGRGFDFHSGETAAAVLAGVTIRSGSADPVTLQGGGISCRNNSNPTINDCIINENFAYGAGAGIFCEDSSPTLNDCSVSDNYMGMGYGGGLACWNGHPTLNRCNIDGNSYCGVNLWDQSNAMFNDCSISMNYGSGVYCIQSSPTFINCTITNNRGDVGGGVQCDNSSPVFDNCTIGWNTAHVGGGIYSYLGSPALTHCEIYGNLSTSHGGGVYCYRDTDPRIESCIISRNFSEQKGSGVYFENTSDPVLTNCTVYGNATYAQYGAISCSDSNLAICNTILWHNIPQAISGGENYPAVSYSDVEGGWNGTGNIDVEPLLTPDGHLRLGSPCFEAGDPNGDYTGQTDVDGESRVSGDRVDIGADEWADGDDDGLPDWWEQRYFGSPTAANPGANEDGDSRNNLEEYTAGTDPCIAPRTFHVAPAGDDDWDGLAPTWDGEHGPKATIQAAIDQTHFYEGDTVSLTGGVYTGSGNKDLDFHGKAITVRGAAGAHACVIDCEFDGGGFYFHSSETADAVVMGLTIQFASERGIYCRYRSGPTIDNCIFRNNYTTAVYCDYSDPILRNCTIDNRYTAVYCNYGKPTLINCIIWCSSGQGIYTPYTNPVVAFCDVKGGWPGTGNINIDPLLTPDGHVQAGSPCLDSGDPNGDYIGRTDCDGEPRMMGGRVDIGADEWLDSDGDELPDWWEAMYFDDPTAADPAADEDNDGRSNLAEYNGGCNPILGPRSFHVNPEGDDAWDGLSPEWDGQHGPKATIQAAIDATAFYEGDEVLLADGTYAGSGNRDLDYFGRRIVVRGVGGDPNACVIDCEESGRGFYFHSGETAESGVGGLTIQNGYIGRDDGGAALCYASDPTFTDCIFRDNYAGGGGGIYLSSSNSAIDRCVFTRNTASGGGGLACEYDCRPTLTNCIFSDNAGSEGGAIHCYYRGSAIFRDCAIDTNTASSAGGGVFCEWYSQPLFVRCVISENATLNGGGIYCTHWSQPILKNCVIRGNFADTRGGGLYSDKSNPAFDNCTFSGNHAASACVCYLYEEAPTFRNTILWSNASQAVMVEDGEPVIQNCDIQGGWPGDGNIDADPLLTPDGHLQAASPCLELGDPESIQPELIDIDYEPRMSGECVDIGADEWLDTDNDALPDWWESL